MREILFRGKAYDNKWVEGCLITVPKYNYFCILEDEDKVHPMDYPYLDATFGTFDGKATPVDPETICQFTGMTDYNGEKIWENDIVKEGCSGLIGTVAWHNELGTYWLSGLSEDYVIKDARIEWDVIGNIFDNPELLSE